MLDVYQRLLFQEEPFFPLKEEFVFLESVGEEERVRGSLPPASKEECEVSGVETGGV